MRCPICLEENVILISTTIPRDIYKCKKCNIRVTIDYLEYSLPKEWLVNDYYKECLEK